jgi:sugar phosphate isomerase/epimerase
MHIAIQLYTVRNQLAADFAGTLRRLGDIGYRAIETYPFPPGITLEAAAEVIAKLGLRVVSMHEELPFGDALPRVCETAAALGCRNVIWSGWPRPAEYDSLNGLKQLAARYNEAHAGLREHGLNFLLHNHWFEFEPVDGVHPLRFFHQELHPEIGLEVDVYWAQTAGVNPASVLQEFAPRIRFLHVKDGPALQGRPMTAVGAGTLNFPGIFAAAPDRVQPVVELDECATDIFEAVDQSLRYLEATLSSQLAD